MPTAPALKSWAAQVPPGFKFVLKAPQSITHFKRLKGAGRLVSQFLKAAGALKGRLGRFSSNCRRNSRRSAAAAEVPVHHPGATAGRLRVPASVLVR
jgi:hypothetical protein